MKCYTVVWWKKAQDDLAAIWLRAKDRDFITFAADEIDRRLADHPTEWGEVLADGQRTMSVRSLQVYFRVFEADRLVEVYRAREVSDDRTKPAS